MAEPEKNPKPRRHRNEPDPDLTPEQIEALIERRAHTLLPPFALLARIVFALGLAGLLTLVAVIPLRGVRAWRAFHLLTFALPAGEILALAVLPAFLVALAVFVFALKNNVHALIHGRWARVTFLLLIVWTGLVVWRDCTLANYRGCIARAVAAANARNEPPAGENGADAYNEAAKALHGAATPPWPVGDDTRAEDPVWRDFVEAHAAVVDRVVAASRKGRVWFTLRLDETSSDEGRPAVLPWPVGIADRDYDALLDLLVASAECSARAGDLDRALNCLHAAWRIGDVTYRAETLAVAVIGLRVTGESIRGLAAIAEAPRLSAADLRRLDETLAVWSASPWMTVEGQNAMDTGIMAVQHNARCRQFAGPAQYLIAELPGWSGFDADWRRRFGAGSSLRVVGAAPSKEPNRPAGSARPRMSQDFSVLVPLSLMAMERGSLDVLRGYVAARRFLSESGRLPTTWNDLVPAYLPHVPLDPETDKAMRLRATSRAAVIYWVRFDGKDDGGRAVFGRQPYTYRDASKRAVQAMAKYLAEQKAMPTRWTDLVPAYLPRVPVDPYTRRPLTWTNTSEGIVLVAPDDLGLGIGWETGWPVGAEFLASEEALSGESDRLSMTRDQLDEGFVLLATDAAKADTDAATPARP